MCDRYGGAVLAYRSISDIVDKIISMEAAIGLLRFNNFLILL
jgi:hypothetical protein